MIQAFLLHCPVRVLNSLRYLGFSNRLSVTSSPRVARPTDRSIHPTMCTTTDTGQRTPQMNQKASRILRVLNELYPKPPASFLDHRDPFTLLIAVVLSAQSLDSVVNTVTPALFDAASTPEEMAALGVARVQNYIRTVGLAPRKAKGIVGLSKIICEEHDGKVPQTMEELIALPSVGRKTASVILMQAFGVPAFPVDTHIHRLACRWGIGHAKSVEKTEMALREWFADEKLWGQLHLQLILFGREHCPARKHDMMLCPICSFASTTEAWKSNASSSTKFIAAAKHKDPYSMRSLEDLDKLRQKGAKRGGAENGGVKPNEAPAGEKRRRSLKRTATAQGRAILSGENNGDEVGPLEKKVRMQATKASDRVTRSQRSMSARKMGAEDKASSLKVEESPKEHGTKSPSLRRSARTKKKK
eukprot:Plantae.Rhodophyta-Hildenbrandia_rubra.ctg12373.p1 GENE.Plantae.Rhodophyta-Hildenbrandia_rubra.ctg12373~~Plantae.Rhodophyta-Hildenbrandia_rubra.ctg12373.p1  ORF type:complete len:416 (+),score=57.02 Plantae.Rhodophyta-Hildenbrandia_rubra.ctg12373:226-1473(+)